MLPKQSQARVRDDAGDKDFWLSHVPEYNRTHVKN
jgi:hypothetical protein